MFVLMRQRNFSLVWLAGLISQTGDWVLLIGLPLYVYLLTHSTLSTALTFMVGAVPSLLLGQVAGVFVDRWNRKRLLVVANILLALVLLPLLLVHSQATLWIVYAVQFVAACFSQFLTPATDALLPSLVSEDQLVAANSFVSVGANVTRLIGPPLGGLVVVALGLGGAAAVDAASFALAALLVAFITLAPRTTETQESAQRSLRAVWGELLDGMRLIVRSRTVSVVFWSLALTSIGEGVFGALLAPFVTSVLHGSGQDYGWFVGLQAVGGLFGSLVIGRFGRRVPARLLIGLGTMGLGVVDFAIFLYPLILHGVTLAFILIAVAGLPASASGVGLITLLQREVADQFRGRVFAAVGVTFTLFGLIGEALAGLLGDRVGIIPIISVHACTLLLGGALALALLRDTTRASDAPEPTPTETSANSQPMVAEPLITVETPTAPTAS